MTFRLALIGNMNNNHFAAMRYFRDLGIDAELLMYMNETRHFYPQHDTWEWEKWRPYVRQLGVSNGGPDSLVINKRRLNAMFGGYDAYMGNGIAPVLFQRMGRKLDLFVPYSEGIEFIIHHSFNWKRPKSTAFSWLRKTKMERALCSSVKASVTANLHPHSQNSFLRLNIEPVNLPLLSLYREQSQRSVSLPHTILPLLDRLQRSGLVVFSHVSHIWRKLPVPHFMGGVGKRNNWLIQGFAEYLKKTKNCDAILCLFEYGVDVPESKRLIDDLNISDQVIWFPQLSRREIMCILPYVDIGASEFAGMYWGGCGWEFLASGVPMLHQLDDANAYESRDVPLPPFFNVHSPSEICKVLLENDRSTLKQVGARAGEWFDRYQGQALAGRYLRLIKELRG